MERVKRWLQATVDNKPWWAIILAAFLASLGPELMKSVPDLIAWGRSFRPIEPTIYVFLKAANTSAPIDGARVSIMDAGSGSFLQIEGANQTFVTTRQGIATARVRAMPRPGYALVLTHLEGNREYRNTIPIELRGDLQHQIEFDPGKWATAAAPPPERPLAQPAATPAGSQADLPPWMKFAYGELGQREIRGPNHNPRILEYFRSVRMPNVPQDDETDWSSAFIHWALRQAGIAGTNSLLDRSWMNWGKPTDLKAGCIAVFWRDTPDGQFGHAGFFVGQRDDGTPIILGGNQSDEVRLSPLLKSRLLGCRWPT
jgi:uncharacterized protein (TIGR02594 family)